MKLLKRAHAFRQQPGASLTAPVARSATPRPDSSDGVRGGGAEQGAAGILRVELEAEVLPGGSLGEQPHHAGGEGGSPVTHAPVGRAPRLPPVRWRFALVRRRAHPSASESETFGMIFSVTSAGQEKLCRNASRDSHTCCCEGRRHAATWFWQFGDKSDYFFFCRIHFFPDAVSAMSAAHRLPHS